MSLSSLLLILCILLCLWLLPQRKEHFEENAMNVQTGNSEKGMFMIDVNNTINASFVVSALPLKNVQIVDSKGVTRTLDIVQMEKLEGGSGNDKYGSWNWHKVFLSEDVIVSPYSLVQIKTQQPPSPHGNNAVKVQTGNTEKGMFMIDVNDAINASFVSALPLKNAHIVDGKGVTRTLDIVKMEKLEGGSGNDKYGSWNWHKVFLSEDVIVSPYSLVQIIAQPVTQPVTRPGPVNQPVLTSNSQYTVIPPTNLTLS